MLLVTSISWTREHSWYDGIEDRWKLGLIEGTLDDLIVDIEEESENRVKDSFIKRLLKGYL